MASPVRSLPIPLRMGDIDFFNSLHKNVCCYYFPAPTRTNRLFGRWPQCWKVFRFEKFVRNEMFIQVDYVIIWELKFDCGRKAGFSLRCKQRSSINFLKLIHRLK